MAALSSHRLNHAGLILCFLFAFSTHIHAQQSPHGPLSIPCTDCHTTASWKELATPMRFNHSETSFPLNGQHSLTACTKCHTGKKFSGTPTRCMDCHRKDFDRVPTPNHKIGNFSYDCMTCHTMKGWLPSVFQHSKTNFQLAGAHEAVDCASCHVNNKFAGLSRDCFACHQPAYDRTMLPNHKTGQLSHECVTCHTMNSWKPSTFDHQKTSFALSGAHQTADCASCHANGRFKGTAKDCYSCHTTDYSKSVQPNHVTAQLSHDCTMCHSTTVFKPALFDHQKTKFPLSGAHRNTECASCHKSGHFADLQTDCYSCHQADF
ncbi:MAG TPA: cytochrome c3 family protein, partial [Bacteroidota bacterium]|nr:cytochrome c3 family protein [Bacteroidota bacterium]